MAKFQENKEPGQEFRLHATIGNDERGVDEMTYKYSINIEYCKGCGLCVTVCPKKSIGNHQPGKPKRLFSGLSGASR